jgi:hypothetical protein
VFDVVLAWLAVRVGIPKIMVLLCQMRMHLARNQLVHFLIVFIPMKLHQPVNMTLENVPNAQVYWLV